MGDHIEATEKYPVPPEWVKGTCSEAFDTPDRAKRYAYGRQDREASSVNDVVPDVAVMPFSLQTSFEVGPVWDRILLDAAMAVKSRRVGKGSPRVIPDQLAVDTEFRWLRANLCQVPDFKTAPSVGAIKEWVLMHTPGNEKLQVEFVKLGWSRRMASLSAGKGGSGRPKLSGFREDAGSADEEAAWEHDRKLRDRLFGSEGGSTDAED